MTNLSDKILLQVHQNIGPRCENLQQQRKSALEFICLLMNYHKQKCIQLRDNPGPAQ